MTETIKGFKIQGIFPVIENAVFGRPKCLQHHPKTEVSETNLLVANKVNITCYWHS